MLPRLRVTGLVDVMTWRAGLRRGVVFLAALLASGCVLLAPSKASVKVSDIESVFPTIEQLSAVVYMHEPGIDGAADCEYLEYERGAFTSNAADEFCRVFDFDNRHPGGSSEGPAPVTFDAQALTDLAELKKAFDRVSIPLDYMNVVLNPDGHVGPDSGFSPDRCVTYWYQPDWANLPEDITGDSISIGINADWYKTDWCP
jgi:hypothetical protein